MTILTSSLSWRIIMLRKGHLVDSISWKLTIIFDHKIFMENELKKIGLTSNETKIYETLLDIGENTVGPIVKKLNMHRQVVYDGLEGLEKINMVLKSTKNNRTYFRLANPDNIMDNIKQQEAVARNLILEINSKIKGQKRGQEIKIYEGEKAYRDMISRKDNLQPANSEYLVVSGVVMKYKEITSKGGIFQRSNRIRAKKNIKTRLILNDIYRDQAAKFDRVNSEIRFLPEGYTAPTTFDVWHDSITLTSFAGDMFCIEIKNEDFRNSYSKYFELLWKIAKE